MRRHFIFLTALFILAEFIFISTYAQSDKKTPKAVFIILEHIPVDVVEKLKSTDNSKMLKADCFAWIDRLYHFPTEECETKNVSLVGGL